MRICKRVLSSLCFELFAHFVRLLSPLLPAPFTPHPQIDLFRSHFFSLIHLFHLFETSGYPLVSRVSCLPLSIPPPLTWRGFEWRGSIASGVSFRCHYTMRLTPLALSPLLLSAVLSALLAAALFLHSLWSATQTPSPICRSEVAVCRCPHPLPPTVYAACW